MRESEGDRNDDKKREKVKQGSNLNQNPANDSHQHKSSDAAF